MGYQSIKKWPEGERPRERLLNAGELIGIMEKGSIKKG
jgi:hypothetical protein